MYYPYLRGKQFELLAIKEMAQDQSLTRVVHPVIEPVRDLNSGGLERCVETLLRVGSSCTLIVNPQVGHLAGDSSSVHKLVSFLNDRPHLLDHVTLGVVVSAVDDLESVQHNLSALNVGTPKVSFFHLDFPEDAAQVFGFYSTSIVESHFVESVSDTRRYRSLSGFQAVAPVWGVTPLVKWRDPFPRQARNIDYVGIPEQLYTDDHLYFADDGFVGISDYQTIGDDYQDGGRLPRAVVLHLTYQKESDGPIFIRHFPSDSNLDASDTAGKFAEAVKKLVSFADERNLANPAIDKFRFYALNESFPGLGTLKKVSIQNHIYVMQHALGEL
ncbi:sce7725 family protein [Arthrobacter sp. AK01]|uniref:sce7725 family protein n=1 Tax=Arthrobacter sp. AK01 TaxID=2894084 RepID=UPI001E336C0B|nr:sce7725 family protein [Arthrobacter sp. AK01]MCD4852424.1 sce7725 family protein [Arthrobacter sp. AK01]